LDFRPTASDLNQRRQYRRASFDEGASNLAQVAQAIESREPLDVEQIKTFERIIKWEIDALTTDLKGKSTNSGNLYPTNLTMANHYEYIVLPTLVYELEYPRSEKINWYYVAEKGIAVFGVLGIMNMVGQVRNPASFLPISGGSGYMSPTPSKLSERLGCEMLFSKSHPCLVSLLFKHSQSS
jgi:sterol O-acyltransferase